MNPDITTLAGWSYGLAGFSYGALTLYVVSNWRGGLRNSALLFGVGASAVWGVLSFIFVLTQYPMLLTAGAFADVARLGGFFALLLSLIDRPLAAGGTSSAFRPFWLAITAGALVVVGLAAQGMIALGVAGVGDPGRLMLLDSLAMTVLGLVLVEQLFRNAAGDSRWNIKPLCLGMAGAFMFDLYLYSDALLFNRIDNDAFSVRGLVYALVMPLIAISVGRNRDMTFRIVLSRQVVFHSAALMSTAVYLLFMAAAGYYVRFFGGDWGRAVQVALLFASLLLLGLLAFSASVRAKLRVQVNKHFFGYRYDYREEWLRFTRTLSAQDGSQQMGHRVIRGLADLVESPAGGLWLRGATDNVFSQVASWNLPATDGLADADSEFCRFLGESGWVINLEEFRASPGRYGSLALPEWLSSVPNAWLIVPLAATNELIGFAVLATARTSLDVNWEVNDLLKTAGRQAASFLGQVLATEALLEARKFDAFNRMSAFVVHDLKNIIAQLSLMTKNAKRHRDNPEFQQDMLMTVEHSVERMKQLMMQLREGATPVNSPRPVDMAEVIRRIRDAKATQEPAIELQLADRVIAKGHADRLERVVGHIVQNALDATEDRGRVCVKLERQGDLVMVEIADTGHGMTPEFIRERLFKPFQTTKQGGMGIGAYESFQYVQELGGRVLVDSTPGVGTRVRVLLPFFESGSNSELPHQEVA